ncbi:MmpS family transport accessory protein [Mycolicibacterium sp. XJ870]
MTDSPRRDGSEPTQQLGSEYPVDYPDPAYANQPPYGGVYPAVPNSGVEATRRLPPYGYDPSASGQYGAGQYGTGQYGTGYPPPGEPPQEPDGREPRLWLWMLAALAVLVVVGLVIALVIANGSRQETVVAPQPVTPEPSFSTPSTAPTTTPRAPRPVPAPNTPPGTATPGVTETVTYEVAGEGRAINITYLDTGNMLQTEFNVMLPWSKQVELPQPASQTASVSVLNFGPEVSCTVTVDGVEIQHRSGSGLTICVGSP